MTKLLYKSPENSLYKRIDLEDGEHGEIRVFTHLVGEDVKRHWGDADLEIWSDLAPAHFRAMLVVLLERFLTGHEDAHERFEKLAKEAGVPLHKASWT